MEVAQITWEEFEKNVVKTQGTFIDIRTKEEYVRGHIPQAIHLSAEDIEAGVSLPKGILYIYCDTGIQSLSVVRFLIKKRISGDKFKRWVSSIYK